MFCDEASYLNLTYVPGVLRAEVVILTISHLYTSFLDNCMQHGAEVFKYKTLLYSLICKETTIIGMLFNCHIQTANDIMPYIACIIKYIICIVCHKYIKSGKSDFDW